MNDQNNRAVLVGQSWPDVARIEGRPVRVTIGPGAGVHSTSLALTYAEADELRQALAAWLAAAGDPLAIVCPACGARPGYPCAGRIAGHSARWNEAVRGI